VFVYQTSRHYFLRVCNYVDGFVAEDDVNAVLKMEELSET
jgi:hypothetical protein